MLNSILWRPGSEASKRGPKNDDRRGAGGAWDEAWDLRVRVVNFIADRIGDAMNQTPGDRIDQPALFELTMAFCRTQNQAYNMVYGIPGDHSQVNDARY